MPSLSRRELVLRALRCGAAAGLAPGLIARARAADSCVAPDSEGLRASLNYSSEAADPAQSCARCAFFSAEGSNAACGNCTILTGPADASGHCDSWSPPS